MCDTGDSLKVPFQPQGIKRSLCKEFSHKLDITKRVLDIPGKKVNFDVDEMM